jgi:hypothetical protein
MTEMTQMPESPNLATAFPRPPAVVATAFDDLREATAGQPGSMDGSRESARLPRPWDPATCAPELRRPLYVWLDEVVEWINREHTWGFARLIPTCWDRHPHLVQELAVVAAERWEARLDTTPVALADWQQRTLPLFLNRMAIMTTEGGCPPRKHESRSRYEAIYYLSSDAIADRRQRRKRDLSADPGHGRAQGAHQDQSEPAATTHAPLQRDW